MPPLLELSRVTKRFGGLEALRDVSLTFGIGGGVGGGGAAERGSLTAVIGPNGAGKTTLFDVVSGLTRPTSGTVRLDGVDLAGLPRHRLARLGVGRTFQITCLFPGLTVLDNVLVGVTFGARPPRWRAERRQAAERLLALVGLAERAETCAHALSLGER